MRKHMAYARSKGFLMCAHERYNNGQSSTQAKVNDRGVNDGCASNLDRPVQMLTKQGYNPEKMLLV